MLTKSALRRQLLVQRQALSAEEWVLKSNALCVNLSRSVWLQQATTILVYLSHRQEPNLSPLWLKLLPQRRWGLPRCVDKALVWHEWQPTQPNQLQQGAYGIWEPLPTLPPLEAAAVDMMLVPAVACDRQGFRLGYGGGFYDRLLSQPEWAAIPTIGIVFDFAYVEALAADPWDCPLQGVCTEQGLYGFQALTKFSGF